MDELAQRGIDFISANRDWAFWLALVFARGRRQPSCRS
jgi:hypothetical protein